MRGTHAPIDLQAHACAIPPSPFAAAQLQHAAAHEQALLRRATLQHSATAPSPVTRSRAASSDALSWVAAWGAIAEEQGCAVPAPFGGTWRKGLDCADALSPRCAS